MSWSYSTLVAEVYDFHLPVGYSNGDVEYYDLTRDPFEIRNTAAAIRPAKRQRLHDMLTALEKCHDAARCWTASRSP